MLRKFSLDALRGPEELLGILVSDWLPVSFIMISVVVVVVSLVKLSLVFLVSLRSAYISSKFS